MSVESKRREVEKGGIFVVVVVVAVLLLQTHRRSYFFPIVSNFSIMKAPALLVLLDYFGVSRIQRTLTWTTGFLKCLCDLFACVYSRWTSVYSFI